MEIPKITVPVSTPAVDTDQLLRRIASGNAVLFVGSGFAAGATNLLGEEMLRAGDLAKKLAEVGGFEADDDLRYITDLYIRDGDPIVLVDYLKKAFTVTELVEHQIRIVAAGWRRVYTTNYDLVVERAGQKAGRMFETIEIDQAPADHLSKQNLCVHLNGSVHNLSVESLNGAFKLSNSSYVAPDSFVTSRWLYPFRRDLERASAVVFVGYSLYDIEVQRVLFENPELRQKTYFVCGSGMAKKEKFTLEKYGVILDLDATQFGELLLRELGKFVEEADPLFTSAFIRHQSSHAEAPVRDAQVETFLMHGDISDDLIDDAVRGIQEVPFIIVRNELDQIRDYVIRGQSVVITADFGNGKSIILREIGSLLAIDGFLVYEFFDADGDYIGDVEKLSKTEGRKVLIVDDYDRCIDLVEYVANYSPPNIVLVLSSRTANHERLKTKTVEMGFNHLDIAVDHISRNEAEHFVDILDNVGFWGAEASLSRDRKIARITQDGRSQISAILLEIFESQQMKRRVSELIAPLMRNHEFSATIFAIALLETAGLPLHISLISRVAQNDAIFTPALRDDVNFTQAFNFNSGVVRSKSSIFGLVLLRNNFSGTVIVDNMLSFVASVGDSRGDSREIQYLFKQLLRFAYVERVLPEKNRKDNLVRYYESLKRHLSWLSREPHYWVQYAMALLTYYDFERAQQMLDAAYALAERRDGYHTDNIDTQQARLYLLRCINEADPNASSRHFQECHKILSRVPDDIGKLRQLERYREVYRTKYSGFPVGGKVAFEHACRAALNSLQQTSNGKLLSPHAEYVAQGVSAFLSEILGEIAAARGKG